MKHKEEIPQSDMLIYSAEDGRTRISVRMDAETVWLTQAQMMELFQVSKSNISMHIRNIIKEEELDRHSVVKEYLTTAADGKNYRVNYYNLDMNIAVGYRVRSLRGMQFRQCATELHVLDNPGTVSHDQALSWATTQYNAFSERRRLEAETVADERYIEDLKKTAKALECQQQPGAAKKGETQVTRAFRRLNGPFYHRTAGLRCRDAIHQCRFASRQNHHETLDHVSFSWVSCSKRRAAR